MSGSCVPHHDWFTATLTFGLCCGLIISYAPQHFRIIHAGSSEGFSPLFLLLGSTSSAAGMLNMVTMQWGIVKCCRQVSFGSCVEMTGGVVQVGLQWMLFTIVFVLYMIYYPPHLKYTRVDTSTHDVQLSPHIKNPIYSNEWRLSIVLAWVTAGHFIISLVTTVYLLITYPPSSTSPLPIQISQWATLLGVTSAILSVIQYAPQLIHTYKMKLVGALSIPMMLIQSPGAVIMVTSIALRPGTNWTSWITFAVAGLMQGSLLIMCILWKYRQRRLNLDDFGNSLVSDQVNETSQLPEDIVPGLVADGDDPITIQVALNAALDSAARDDVRSGLIDPAVELPVGEDTPLLGTSAVKRQGTKTWLRWFK